jgi:hypothetical protein
MQYLKKRTITLFTVAAILLITLYLTDPDNGASTAMLVLGVVSGVLGVILTHVLWKALFDFPEMHLQNMFKKASESPEGSGLSLIAVAIVMAALLLMFGGKAHAANIDVRTYIPANAKIYAPTLVEQKKLYWNTHPMPETLGGLVEQESCAALTWKSCWNPKAQLKSAREEGAGLGQITRAYDTNGKTRFDALKEIVAKYPAQLGELNWGDVYSRPDLQLRALVLKSKDNFDSVTRVTPTANSSDKLAFADAAYNGGFGGLQQDRRKCQLIKDCLPNMWFGNVEKTCTKSRVALYGQKNACDINREHVYNVMSLRSSKYRVFFDA